MKKSALIGLAMTVFLDMLGFSLFFPDLQLRFKDLAAAALHVPADSPNTQLGLLIGFAIALYSLAQFLVAPIMGRLSDAQGRRTVLRWSCALTLVSYLIYAHAHSYEYVLLSRLVGGLGAANIGVAFAYVADVTTPEDRGKGMGLVGASLGMGFVLGPPLGVLLLSLGHNSPLLLGYVAAVLTAVNLAYIQFILPESPRGDHHGEAPTLLQNFLTAIRVPRLRIFLLMTFVITLGFTNLETTFFQLLESPLGPYRLPEVQAKHAGGLILTFVGLTMAIVQGGLVGPAIRRFGELNLVRVGFMITAVGLFLVPHGQLWIPTLAVTALLGLGNGVANPSLSALVSQSAPVAMQGGIFGITMALGALARVIGPLISNPLFQANPGWPYWLGSALVILPALFAWSLRPAAQELPA